MNEIATTMKRDGAPTISSRRRFIASMVAAALGVTVADVLGSGELRAAPVGCSTAGDAFVPVGEFPSKNKRLAVNMTVRSTEKSIATIAGQGYQCRQMKVRYYDAQDLNTSSKWPKNPALPGPGPTLRMRVGDQVHVNLVNAIDPSQFPPSNAMTCDVETTFTPPGPPVNLYPGAQNPDTPPSCFHGDNITNLHYHGTHVTPNGHGDNVMVDVYPKGHVPPPSPPNSYQFPNNFTIPLPPPDSNSTDFSKPFQMGQAPGTHWYHAHKHGSVALQLLNGMAGAFIIEGEFDDQLETLLPGLRSTEKVMVIQQLGDTITIEPGPPLYTCAGGDPLPLVNGQLQPTIEMKPGEIQRWRFVNATMQQVSHLTYRFIGQDVYSTYNAASATRGSAFPSDSGYAPEIRQIAYDGIQLAPERYDDTAFGRSQEFTMAPGNRVDILVKAPATPGKSVLAFKLLHGRPPAGCPVRTLVDLFLLNLNVTGSPVSPPMSFPIVTSDPKTSYPAMPSWLQWNEKDPRNKILKERTLHFDTVDYSIDQTGRPAIDGRAFDMKADTAQCVSLDTAEEWTLKNYWDSSIHPFHIHVNPFQVLEVFDPNAATQVVLSAPYNWYDTIAIPASKTVGTDLTPGYVKIRTRFVDFPGTFVLHCHILDHEDRGMMQEVQVVDSKSAACPAVLMHH